MQAAWLPFAEHPDVFHRFIAESSFGKWSTRQIFKIISDDFIKSNNQQDLPQTIPSHPLANALSGALHVEPPGYIDCVRNGSITIVEGHIQSLSAASVTVATTRGSSQNIQADNVLLATGYKLVGSIQIKSLNSSYYTGELADPGSKGPAFFLAGYN